MPIANPMELVCNTSDDVKAEHTAINSVRKVRRFATQPKREGTAVIVGGGPSLAGFVDEIRARKTNGHSIWATNNTFQYLVERGIVPDAHVILDSRNDNARFLRPTKGVTYYLHASCAPLLYDTLAGYDVVMYDLSGAGTGTTVGLKALYLAGFSGYRRFALYGMDSSYSDAGDHHAYYQGMNDDENIAEVVVEGRKFRAAPWMAYQADEFQQIAASFANQDAVITVHGDGLLPHIAAMMMREDKPLTAVYDLAVSPPTYDFISFLGEAERERLARGATCIDVVFQPGPMGGFRLDDLPPGVAEREAMLQNICLPACWLLPSVRNVTVLKKRQALDDTMLKGEMFPATWSENSPVSHYGTRFFKLAKPILRATDRAREYVKDVMSEGRYVTITLRQAEYWPSRNSNRYAWQMAGEWISDQGYQVVVIPETAKAHMHTSSIGAIAARDLAVRVALYETAECNLGVASGPTSLMHYLQCRYLIFKPIVVDCPSTTPAFLAAHGVAVGDQYTDRGRIIWADDTYDTIKDAFTWIMRSKDK